MEQVRGELPIQSAYLPIIAIVQFLLYFQLPNIHPEITRQHSHRLFPYIEAACLVAAHVNVFEVKMTAGDTKGYSRN